MRMLPLKGLAISTSIFILAGCATPVDQLAEKPYCHTDRGRNAYCTKENAPSLKRDEEAKQFPSNPEALTVYLVRYWGDGHHPLDISVNGGTAMETVSELNDPPTGKGWQPSNRLQCWRKVV